MQPIVHIDIGLMDAPVGKYSALDYPPIAAQVGLPSVVRGSLAIIHEKAG